MPEFNLLDPSDPSTGIGFYPAEFTGTDAFPGEAADASLNPLAADTGGSPGDSGSEPEAGSDDDPAIRQQVLNKIASGEATSYNELYGGGRFTDYSQHPNIRLYTPEGTPTTAAGRYQFTNGTWQEEAQKLGLKDFSPASQDKAAWDLANTTYKQETGRDLTTDAKAGKVDWKALGGRWTSLANAADGPGLAQAAPSMDRSVQPINSNPPESQTAASAQSGGEIGDPTKKTANPMMAIMMLQLLAPKHQFTPVNYDPFKVAPELSYTPFQIR